jgi:hypothetical protein
MCAGRKGEPVHQKRHEFSEDMLLLLPIVSPKSTKTKVGAAWNGLALCVTDLR